MRKHVEHAGSLERKAMFVHQHRQVSGEAAWMTGNIQHPPRIEAGDGCQHLAGPDPGWIEKYVGVGLACPGSTRLRRLPEIRHVEFSVGYIVATRVVASALDQGGLALHAHDPSRYLGECQGKVADPAVQVENTRGGRRLQQLHGTRDESLVDGGVDLYEIRRRELELQPEARQ